MASTFFTLSLAPAEVRKRPPAERLAFQQFATEYALRRKDRELSMGLNARGEPLPGVKPTTRENRRSEMTPTGKGDARAPYLMPGRGLSRTRSLLAGKAYVDYCILSWRFDPWTGDQWGKILAIHARRGKAYDVIGLSAKGKAWVAMKALAAWRSWKAGKLQFPTYQASEGPMTIPLVGRTNFDHATEGIGGSIEDAKRAIAEGRGSGMLSAEEWRKYFSAPKGSIAPSMPGTSYSVRSGKSSVLLQHIWGGGGKPAAGAAAGSTPKAPKAPKTPKPAKSLAALLPKPAPKAPPADAEAFAFNPPKPPPEPAAPPRPEPWKPTEAERREAALAEARRAEFPGEAEFREWADATYGGAQGRWWRSLTDKQRREIRDYTGSYYSGTNDYLRAPADRRSKLSEPHIREVTRQIDPALAETPTPRTIVVYRGVGSPRRFLDSIGLASRDDLRPGVVFADPAYTSTTIDPRVAADLAVKRTPPEEAIQFKILVPAGSDGAWIGDNSLLAEEKEFLLGRALDSFEVVGRDGEWIVLRAFESSKGK